MYSTLYTTYVRPHLEFSTPAWSPWLAGDKSCLELVQIKAVKMISGLKSNDYTERLQELGLETLEERRERADMVLVNKIVAGEADLKKEHWFDMADPARVATRAASNRLNIVQKRCNLDMRRHFFSERAARKWNELPTELRAKPADKFKSAYNTQIGRAHV